MPATQISFLAFALAAFADNTSLMGVPGGVDTRQAVVLCTPSVTNAAIAVVAHPLAVDGGECSALEVFVPCRSLACSDIRDDFWRGDDLVPDWACVGLDAPSFLPSGGTSTFDAGGGRLFVDGYTHSRF